MIILDKEYYNIIDERNRKEESYSIIQTFTRVLTNRKQTRDDVIQTCGHMIHAKCYKQAKFTKCPMCRSYTNSLFPLPLIPTFNMQFRRRFIQNPVYTSPIEQKDEFTRLLASQQAKINKQLMIDSSVMIDYPFIVCSSLLLEFLGISCNFLEVIEIEIDSQIQIEIDNI